MAINALADLMTSDAPPAAQNQLAQYAPPSPRLRPTVGPVQGLADLTTVDEPPVLAHDANYNTVLSAKDEVAFQKWKAVNAPNDSGADYDLRGAFKAGLTPAANGHWPDTFKKPNHPTFSVESKYAKDAPEKAGKWNGDTYLPPGTPLAKGDKQQVNGIADLTTFDEPPPDTRGELEKGLFSGVIGSNLKMTGGALMGIGVLTDNPNMEGIGVNLNKMGQEQIDFTKPRVPTFRDIRTDNPINFFNDLAGFAGYQFGNMTGTSVPSLVGGVAASALTANPLIGIAVGAAGPSYLQNYGDVYTSAIEDPAIAARVASGQLTKKFVAGVSAVAAIPIAAFDTLSLETVVGKVVFDKAKRALIGRVVHGIVVGSIAEGSTEGIQQVIQEFTTAYFGSNASLADHVLSVLDNAVAGFIGGGGLGAIGGAGSGHNAPAPAPGVTVAPTAPGAPPAPPAPPAAAAVSPAPGSPAPAAPAAAAPADLTPEDQKVLDSLRKQSEATGATPAETERDVARFRDELIKMEAEDKAKTAPAPAAPAPTERPLVPGTSLQPGEKINPANGNVILAPTESGGGTPAAAAPPAEPVPAGKVNPLSGKVTLAPGTVAAGEAGAPAPAPPPEAKPSAPAVAVTPPTAPVPTITELTAALPKDTAGDPDIGYLAKTVEDVAGKPVGWNGLTDPQKQAVFEAVKNPVTKGAFDQGISDLVTHEAPNVLTAAPAPIAAEAGAAVEAAQPAGKSLLDKVLAAKTADTLREATNALVAAQPALGTIATAVGQETAYSRLETLRSVLDKLAAKDRRPEPSSGKGKKAAAAHDTAIAEWKPREASRRIIRDQINAKLAAQTVAALAKAGINAGDTVRFAGTVHDGRTGEAVKEPVVGPIGHLSSQPAATIYSNGGVLHLTPDDIARRVTKLSEAEQKAHAKGKAGAKPMAEGSIQAKPKAAAPKSTGKSGNATVATPKAEPSKWTEIGKNHIGQTLYEDQRGVRSYIENGVRVTEPVQITPQRGGGVAISTDRAASPEWMVTEPHPALAPAKPAPTEHPGLIVKSLVTGKEETIQPPGTVAPKAAASATVEAPEWAEVVNVLPFDKSGHTRQTEIAFAAMTEITGDPKPAWKDLTAEQKVQVFDKVKAAVAKPAAPATPAAPQSADYGAKNVLVSKDRADELRARLKNKLKNQVSSGIDPEIMAIGAELAVFHIEAGARKFTALAKAIADDLGVTVQSLRQYLRGWYNGARDLMEDGGANIAGMDDAAAVAAALKTIDQTEGAANGSKQLEGAGPAALEGVPAPAVQVPQGGGEPGKGAGLRGGANEVRNGQPGAARPAAEPGVGTNQARVPVPAGKQVVSAATPAAERSANYVLTEADQLGEGGAKTKFNQNIAAIKLVRTLGRAATPDEQAVLAKYVGWGGLKQAFPHEDGTFTKGWEDAGAALKALLSPDEYKAARASTQNAHYTSPTVVQAMWKAAERLGFRGGRVLEPSTGTGNFLGFMPTQAREAAQITGVELDRITGDIAKNLYPDANIQAPVGFQEFTAPDGWFDLAIGNPPFGAVRIYDPRRKKISRFSIHNFFFAKSVDMLREDGVLAMVVTNFMMDAARDGARSYIAGKTELLGAIRLPNDAFAKNAGTEVTTDIVFLRKLKAGEKAKGESWLDAKVFKDKEGREVLLNEYYVRHPGQMLGEFGAYGEMYAGESSALIARPGQDTAALLDAAIARLPKNVMPEPGTSVHLEQPTAPHQTSEAIVGSMFLANDGKVWMRGEDIAGTPRAEPVDFVSDKARERVAGMVGIRDAFALLRKAQLEPASTDAKIASLRKALNAAYDRFVAKNGPLNAQVNKSLFREDPTWPQVSALEETYDRGISPAVAKKTGEKARAQSAVKAAIFSRRTQTPYQAPTSAATAKDALAASLVKSGHVDMAMMADLYGKSEEAIVKELGDLLYKNPVGGYETTDHYLSGNVKQKLALAERAVTGDRQYQRNVEALKAAIPADIPAVKIAVKPGAHWLPPQHVSAFAEHILGTAQGMIYVPATAGWVYSGRNNGTMNASEIRWGTDRAYARDVLAAAINGRQMTISDKNPDGTTTVNQTATAAANAKVEGVKEDWKNWVWEDDARRTELHRLYNDSFNTDKKRVYDGSHLTFEGKVGDDIVHLRPHQAGMVWRIVQSGTALLDHVVGSGKTFTMIAAAMEMRRMGIAKKPMFVVPNHLVGQWAKAFIQLYPGANILAATKKDFEKENRKRLFARVATGDYDAVIVAHSSFGRVAVDPKFEKAFIETQLADLEASIKAVQQATGEKKSRTVAQIEKQRDNLRAKLQRLIDTGGKDENLTFEEMGVDALFVDEAHEFKNLGFSTSMQRVAGLGNQQGSQKAADLYVKVQSVLERTGGRNAVFATGTPISNTMAEMYTMQRYLDHRAMKDMGLSHFDAWARMFGEVVTDWELSPSGRYKLNSRFSKFVNLPELMQRYHSFADVITNDDIKAQLALIGETLPLPKVKGGKPANLVVERSPAQAAFIGTAIIDENGNETYAKGTLIWRSENLPKGPPQKGDDNMLAIMSDARKAALDMRLINPSSRDVPGSKVHVAADNVKRLYDAWNADKGAQLVFIDLSTPKAARAAEAEAIRQLIKAAEAGDEAAQEKLDAMSPDEFLALDSEFSVYDDLRQKLIDRGIPAKEIAFIHSAKTDNQKEELFGQVRSGRVRVLLGSTAKMGAGMNVQERLVAVHHLDAPWRPADLEQREGRIIRQGNKLRDANPDKFEVEILRYATKGTLDARMWQTIEAKARFIEQIRKGSDDREMEDVAGEAANSAEMKASSSGNPLVLEEMTLRTELRKLDMSRYNHNAEQHRVRDELKSVRSRIADFEKELPAVRQDAAAAATIPDGFSVMVAGQTITKPKEAGEAILVEYGKFVDAKADTAALGSYGPFRMSLVKGLGGDSVVLKSDVSRYSVDIKKDSDATGLAMRLRGVIQQMKEAPASFEGRIANWRTEIPKLESQVKPWADAGKLADTKARHDAVIQELKPKPKPPAQPGAIPAGAPIKQGSTAARAQTETPAFRAWFASSKVVDDDGKPLVVYHGTDASFDTFDKEALGRSTMHPTASLGFWFSASPKVADLFSQAVDDSTWPPKLVQRKGANTIPAYLSIKKPYVMSVEQFRNIQAQPFGESFEREQPEAARSTRETMAHAKARLVELGYDGIHIPGDPKYADHISGEEYSADAWVAFEPTQIKSATGNTGAFNPEVASVLGATSNAPVVLTLTPAQRISAERAVVSIIKRVAGRDVQITMPDTIDATTAGDAKYKADMEAYQRRGGKVNATAGGVSTSYPDGRAIIDIAMADPKYDPIASAFHEAYHRLEVQLMTPGEFIQVSDPDATNQARLMAAKVLGLDPTLDADRIGAMVGYEARAIGFEGYALRAMKLDALGAIPAALRRFYVRLRKIANEVRAFLMRQPYAASLKDIYERAYSGEIGGRDVQGFRNPSQFGATAARGSQTEIPAFRAWFQGSKVVDAEGNPLRVYHGTGASFDAFRHGSFPGFYFASNPGVASFFARANQKGGAAQVYPVNLRITNPKRIAEGGPGLWAQLKGWITGKDPALYGVGGKAAVLLHNTVARLKAQGYDGIATTWDGEKVWIAFDPEQIKSAIGNRGTFDPSVASILGSTIPRTPTSAAVSRADRAAQKTFIRNQEDELHKITTGTEADISEMSEAVKALPANYDQALDEELYLYGEDKAGHPLSPDKQAIWDRDVGPIQAKAHASWLEATALARDLGLSVEEQGELGADPTEYMHRMAKGHTALFGDDTGTNDAIVGGRSLPRSAPSMRSAVYQAVERGGRRMVVSKGKNGGIVVWRGGTPFPLAESNDLVQGGKIDIGGAEWNVVRARTPEIEANTNTTYYKSAIVATMSNLVRLRRVVRVLTYTKALKASPEWQASAVPDRQAQPAGWKRVEAPGFRNFWIAPKLANPLNDFVQGGARVFNGDIANRIEMVSNYAVRSLFWNPLPHAMNVATHWGVSRGWDWVNPIGYRNLVVDGMRAIKAVVSQNQDYRDYLGDGAALMAARSRNRGFWDFLLQRVGHDVEKNRNRFQSIADILGYKRVEDFITGLYGGVANILWSANDVFMLQRIMELERKAPPSAARPGSNSGQPDARMARAWAIEEAGNSIPDYRIPSEIAGSRALSVLMQDPTFSMFGRYHYGIFKAYARDVAGVVGKGRAPQERFEAIGRLMALGMLVFVLYPLLDWGLQAILGDENAKAVRRGAATLPNALMEMAKGNRNWLQVALGFFSPAPIPLGIVEQAFNRELYLSQFGDRSGIIAKANDDWKQQVIDRVTHAATGVLLFGQVEQAWSAGSPQHLLMSQAGVTVPTKASLFFQIKDRADQVTAAMRKAAEAGDSATVNAIARDNKAVLAVRTEVDRIANATKKLSKAELDKLYVQALVDFKVAGGKL